MRKRLRVLHLGKYYPPHRGGMETYLEMLCEELRDRVEFTVVAANDGWRTSRETRRGVAVIRTATIARLASTPICPFLPSVAQKVPADIVHIHLPNPFAIATYFAALSTKPLVISYHSDIVRQRVLGKLLEPMLLAALRRAQVIIASSPQYVATSPLLRRHSIQCRIIPYGVRPEAFQDCDPLAVLEIKRRYGSRLVLGVGRLVYYKGFEYLIRAMIGVDGTLLIVGDGPLRAQLEAVACAAGVAARVHFLCGVDDVVPYYYAANIFVLPSVERSEAFGIVQLEAMACGTPVINTQLASGVPFVSQDGLSGLTVPPKDPAALQAAINVLLNCEELRQRYGSAARDRVLNEFSAKRMADDTLRAYEHASGVQDRAGSAELSRIV
jgi:glycosyltransferase involved in cell wall biosynthesis